MFEKHIHQDSVICRVWKVLELKQHSNRMFALLLSYIYVCFRAWYWHLHVLDDRHNSEVSENHDWPIKHYRQSWKQSLHCMEKSSVNDLRNMMASEFHFCLSDCACEFSSPKWSQSSCMFWISSWLRPSVKMGLGFFSNPPDRIPPCQARA